MKSTERDLSTPMTLAQGQVALNYTHCFTTYHLARVQHNHRDTESIEEKDT